MRKRKGSEPLHQSMRKWSGNWYISVAKAFLKKKAVGVCSEHYNRPRNLFYFDFLNFCHSKTTPLQTWRLINLFFPSI